MIGMNSYEMLGFFEIMAPMLETLNNSEHFAIMYVVVAFGRDPFARPKGDGMKKTCIWVRLTKNAGKSEARIIIEKRWIGVEVMYDRCRRE
jgi:hypothetical protein